MKQARIYIDVLSGLRAGETVQAACDELVLGRHPMCDVSFPNEIEVSKHHARIWRTDACWLIEDLGSANGTFLRSAGGPVPIQSPVALGNGVEILLGRVGLRLRVELHPETASDILQVIWKDGQLHFSFFDEAGHEVKASRPFTQQDRRETQRRLGALVMFAHARDTLAEDSTDADILVTLGKELATQVLPDCVADWMIGRKGMPCVIAADAEAAHLPWEMLAPDATPLGLAANLRRTPSVAIAQQDPPPLLHDSGSGGILLVIDPQDEFPRLRKHAECLLDKLTRSEPRHRVSYLAGPQARRIELLRRMEQCDAVYYIGHGRHAAFAPEQSAWLLYDGRVTAKDFRRLNRAPRFVFANGCDTSRETSWNPSQAADEMRGLCSAFLGAGALNYLGAQWPVTAEAAACFGESVFTELLAGRTLPSAVRLARIACQRAHPHVGDWVAYTLYASYEHRLVSG